MFAQDLDAIELKHASHPKFHRWIAREDLEDP